MHLTAFGHVITGNLKNVSDYSVRPIISIESKHRFPNHIDVSHCHVPIAETLHEFGKRWCIREYSESNVLTLSTLSF